ncbi:1-aminocyclopropane-1-carboxylate deaminase/D-cysteine desulfhydrase [Sphingobacterium corticibacter]|uniref:1-aminocyclopropane-1-carboxylate deaminase n=1 Tax=Sphingobacterium corticibacter TaxID=2171749 RepID=A0A2T8HI99_9SPHI|nr:pyridoxal-phosphate dependent enzyme [Sphingobacterium corticibacter]PVH25176.1 1-aminocyclopropane-1-carboxylate deaminase [Sphingobacterium corticibacter]
MSLDFHFNSPVEVLDLPLLRERKVQVSVKRDDLIHPFISGNKWRKLKYILAQAREDHKNTLVTFGGAWSNHLLATACAGAKFGFKTHGFVRGEMVNNPVLAMCRLYGMELNFVDRTAYRDKKTLFDQNFLAQDAVYIEEGGFGDKALLGCAEIVQDLSQEYDHIFVASGTGTTVAGLATGVFERNLSTRVHSIPVLKGGDFLKSDVQSLGVNPDNITFHLDYHFGGYAKHTAELRAFVKEFVQDTGIMIEPTYTGKAFYALFDLVKQDYFVPGDQVVIIHTGGLTGFLGMYDKF